MNVLDGQREATNQEAMLSTTTRLLVAIASAVSLNCKPCLETLVPAALERGVLPEEIDEIVSTVAEGRERVSKLTLDVVTGLTGSENEENSRSTCCGPDCACVKPADSFRREPGSGKRSTNQKHATRKTMKSTRRTK